METTSGAKQIFNQHHLTICRQTDRLFAYLMAVQWPACVLAAVIVSPRSWVGETSSISNNVWAAVFLGGCISVVPILLAVFFPGKPVTRYTIAVCQMLMSGLIVHISGGRVESHFHIFGSLAFLSFYRDWRVLVPATVVVALDHILRGLFWPQSIYGIASPDEWRWLEHAGWVIFEDTFLLIAIRRSLVEMRNNAEHTAEIGQLNSNLEGWVAARTSELAASHAELEIEVANRSRVQSEFEIMSEISREMSATFDLPTLYSASVKGIQKLIRSDSITIALTEPRTNFLRIAHYFDENNPAPDSAYVMDGPAGLVVKRRCPVFLQKEEIQALVDCGDISIVGPMPTNWIGVPIIFGKTIWGVLAVQDLRDRPPFVGADIRFLRAVSQEICLGIERSTADEIRRISEESFRDLFENAPVAYHELDTNGRYTRMNRTEEKLLGYTIDELRGRHLWDIVVEKCTRESIMAKLAGKAEMIAAERTFIRKDGTRVTVLKEDRLIKNEAGETVGMRSTLQDITEMKLLEESVMRGRKLESIGQLAAGIAHEINTPTQYVGDNVRFLAESFEDYQTVVNATKQAIDQSGGNGLTPELTAQIAAAMQKADIDYLMEEVPLAFKQAQSGVERITTIVSSMKEFAHPGSTGKQFADLKKAIESTIVVASNEWKYIADVNTEFDPELPLIPCIVSEFNQVILNMIVNAAHAIADVVGDGSAQKGTITVKTRLAGNNVEITVSDSGAGISNENLSRIFDPFFTTKQVGKGTGQGLAISHNVIVEKHNGSIRVESEVSVGTSFIITLPLTDPNDEIVDAFESEDEAPSPVPFGSVVAASHDVVLA